MAHSDDEILGCGGALAKHVQQGDNVAVVFMTDGVGSRTSSNDQSAMRRSQQMAAALSQIGISNFHQLAFPDNAMDTVPLLEITKSVEAFCQDWGLPDRVYTHHFGDLNIDHQMTHRAVMTCFRPQPDSEKKVSPTEILTFEVLSSTHWNSISSQSAFIPHYFIDISSTLSAKLKAFAEYTDEIRDWPHARSLQAVEHLAKIRGAIVGVDAAEAFVVERIIER